MEDAMQSLPCRVQTEFVTNFIQENLKSTTLPVYLTLSLLSSVTGIVNLFVLNHSTMQALSLPVLLTGFEIANLVLGLCSAVTAVILMAFPQYLLYREMFLTRWTMNSMSLASSTYIVWMTAIICVWRLAEILWPTEQNFTSRFNATIVTTIHCLFGFTSVVIVDLFGLWWMSPKPYLCDVNDVVATAPYLYSVNTVYEDYWSRVCLYAFYRIPTGCALLAIAALVTAACLTAKTSRERNEIALPMLMFGFLLVHVFPDFSSFVYPTIVQDTPFPWRYVVFHGNVLQVAVNILSFPVFYFMSREFREVLRNR